MHGSKWSFSIVFDPFHINRITAVFYRIVSECKRSDTAFSHRIRSFSTVYDTVKYGRNTVHMKRVKYGPFTVINDSIRDGFQRIRPPYLLTWVRMLSFLRHRSVRGAELFTRFNCSQKNYLKGLVCRESLFNQISSFEKNCSSGSVRITHFIE